MNRSSRKKLLLAGQLAFLVCSTGVVIWICWNLAAAICYALDECSY